MYQVDIVCITSKFCNLRCRYCYEFSMLADRTRMSLDQIERMFVNIESYYQGFSTPVEITFAWHGGEPLLIPPDEYRRIFDVQNRVFGKSIHKIANGIQSNFTVIDDDRIALLREHFAAAVGISIDLFSGLRVNKRGICQESRALVNLDRVRAAGIQVGGITVLSKPNLPYVCDIYRFFRQRRMHFRFLPLEKGFYESGQGFEVSEPEVLAALCEVADLWLRDDAPVQVEPLSRYYQFVRHALRRPGNRVSIYTRERPNVLIVDTDGAVYSPGEVFDQSRSGGNIFRQSLGEIMAGRGYYAAAQRAHERMREACRGCSYYGRACGGDPIAEGEPNFVEYEDDGTLRCVVARGLIRHFERYLGGAIGGWRPTSSLVAGDA